MSHQTFIFLCTIKVHLVTLCYEVFSPLEYDAIMLSLSGMEGAASKW